MTQQRDDRQSSVDCGQDYWSIFYFHNWSALALQDDNDVLECKLLLLPFRRRLLVAESSISESCPGWRSVGTLCADLGNQGCEVILLKGALTWGNHKGSGLLNGKQIGSKRGADGEGWRWGDGTCTIPRTTNPRTTNPRTTIPNATILRTTIPRSDNS
jgi:hypothetical protein